MGRAPCCEKVGLKRGKWTADEDEKLIKYIASKGVASWRSLPKMAGLLRCGKSCRLRWMNYLRADLKRGNITKEEDEIILNLHETLGNRWSVIAGHLPGRTDNEIKNHWNTHLKKRAQSFRKSDRENKERTTTMTSTKVSSDDSGSGRSITKKSSNNASAKNVKSNKGDDRSTAQSEESNTTTNRRQFSRTSPIVSDIEMSALDFQRCTVAAEREVAPSFSCATTSHSEHVAGFSTMHITHFSCTSPIIGDMEMSSLDFQPCAENIMISAISNGTDQELSQRETFGLCQELWSPISLVGDSLASGTTCSGGQLNESGVADPQGWAMGDQGELWDWDLEDIEDKLWGEDGEMWSWIRER